MPGIPEPAWKTHADGEDPAVLLRLHGCMELGPGILSLDELKRACKEQAEAGCDPIAAGTCELGLFLPESDYETLLGYAKSLAINRPKRRRRK